MEMGCCTSQRFKYSQDGKTILFGHICERFQKLLISIIAFGSSLPALPSSIWRYIFQLCQYRIFDPSQGVFVTPAEGMYVTCTIPAQYFDLFKDRTTPHEVAQRITREYPGAVRGSIGHGNATASYGWCDGPKDSVPLQIQKIDRKLDIVTLVSPAWTYLNFKELGEETLPIANNGVVSQMRGRVYEYDMICQEGLSGTAMKDHLPAGYPTPKQPLVYTLHMGQMELYRVHNPGTALLKDVVQQQPFSNRVGLLPGLAPYPMFRRIPLFGPNLTQDFFFTPHLAEAFHGLYDFEFSNVENRVLQVRQEKGKPVVRLSKRHLFVLPDGFTVGLDQSLEALYLRDHFPLWFHDPSSFIMAAPVSPKCRILRDLFYKNPPSDEALNYKERCKVHGKAETDDLYIKLFSVICV